MLNGFLEFKAYVTEPESNTPRIQPKMFTDHFKTKNNLIGIEEIMTVIARAYIFSNGKKIYNDSRTVDEKLITDAVELLHRWTGFEDTEVRKRTDNPDLDKWMKKYSVTDKWLKKYWQYWYGKVIKIEEKQWENLEKNWSEKFSTDKATYNNIIAKALQKGPLKEQYIVLEFDSHITKTESNVLRIQPKMFTEHFDTKKNLTVIEGIMTDIARAYIFSNGKKIDSGNVDEKLIADVIELLHRWTGFEDTEDWKRTDNPDLDEWMKIHSVTDKWLKKYWEYWLDISIKNAKEKWGKLEKKWNERLNSSMDFFADKATYNNIIANALEKGPLKERYLVFKKCSEPVKKEEELLFKYLTDKSARKPVTQMKIMKIICSYLIFQEFQAKDQKEVWIKKSELSRWYGLDDGKNGTNTWYPEKVFWNEKPIYTINTIKGNDTKLLVDDEYLKFFEFKLIDIADADKYKETHWVLEDLGHKLEECWQIK